MEVSFIIIRFFDSLRSGITLLREEYVRGKMHILDHKNPYKIKITVKTLTVEY